MSKRFAINQKINGRFGFILVKEQGVKLKDFAQMYTVE